MAAVQQQKFIPHLLRVTLHAFMMYKEILSLSALTNERQPLSPFLICLSVRMATLRASPDEK